MTKTCGFAAELLRRSAAGYAGSAALLMLEKAPDLAQQAGAFGLWKSHLTQRLLELAAALDVGEPLLFTERVAWSRKTFAARGQDEFFIKVSMQSLQEVLADAMPQAAAKPVERFIQAALNVLQQPEPAQDPSMLDPNEPKGRLALSYLRDILDGNCADATRQVVEAVADGLLPAEAYVDVLLGAQREIGRLWHANEISIAEEHLVSTTTQKTMAVLAHTAERQPVNGFTAVTACAAGNAHDMGARALADLYHLAGWRSLFLGADVPVNELPAMLDAYDAGVISLTGTLSTQLQMIAEAIQNIRKHCGHPVKIIIGGAAFDEAPNVAARMGADAYVANLHSVLSVSAKLMAQER